MFFDEWRDLLRILVVGSLAYAGLVLTLRVTGKRTLSKMNAFDFVVTVALGSTLATIVLNADVTLAEGMTAFLLLCGLQYGVAWLSVRSDRFQSFVKSEPALVWRDGRFLDAAMRRERVTRAEIRAALRAAGHARMEAAAAVVLETDGSFSVLPRTEAGGEDALEGVRPGGR